MRRKTEFYTSGNWFVWKKIRIKIAFSKNYSYIPQNVYIIRSDSDIKFNS